MQNKIPFSSSLCLDFGVSTCTTLRAAHTKSRRNDSPSMVCVCIWMLQPSLGKKFPFRYRHQSISSTSLQVESERKKKEKKQQPSRTHATHYHTCERAGVCVCVVVLCTLSTTAGLTFHSLSLILAFYLSRSYFFIGTHCVRLPNSQ